MSHHVEPVYIQANTGTLQINGESVNIHELEFITVDPSGQIIECRKKAPGDHTGFDTCKCGHFQSTHIETPAIYGKCTFEKKGKQPETCQCQAFEDEPEGEQ